jgi:hypothetical protein
MVALLTPLTKELVFLVRVKEVQVMASKDDGEAAEWEEDELDGRPIYIDVS